MSYKNSLIYLFSSVIIIIGVFSLALPASHELPYIQLLFEFAILVLTLLNLKSLDKQLSLFVCLAFLYIYYSFCYFLLNDSLGKISDFLIIYKTFFYIIFLSFISGAKLIEPSQINKFLKILFIIFSLKYITANFLGFNDRPSVFYENNFELLILLILFIASKSINGKASVPFAVSLFLLIIISGSRSAALAFLALVPFMGLFKRKFYLYIFITLSFFVVLYVLFSRSNGNVDIESVDRVQFFLYFLQDISHWGLWEYLFGNPPITPVGKDTAIGLNFYRPLFSNHDELLAFSVLFHSYLMRVIFDHGFIGFIFIACFLFILLKKANYSLSESLAILGVLFANGLSVSSFNNVFAVFSLAVIISLKRSGPIVKPHVALVKI